MSYPDGSLKVREVRENEGIAPTHEDMERDGGGDIDEELGGAGDVVESRQDEISALYCGVGVADWYNFKSIPPVGLGDLGVTEVENDFYLRSLKNVSFFGASKRALSRRYADFAEVSGFDKGRMEYTEFVDRKQPRHAVVGGGKGLTQYTRGVIYTTARMSTINNVNITQGCPANCSFCKESLLSRGYTQIDITERTGVLRIKLDDREFEVAGKTKVKFWDSVREVMVLGPLQVALRYNFPIAKDSLEKLWSGQLTHLIQD